MCYNSNQGQSKTPTAPLGKAKERMMTDNEKVIQYEMTAEEWAANAESFRNPERRIHTTATRGQVIRHCQKLAAEWASKAELLILANSF